jgi:hypothetical protein
MSSPVIPDADRVALRSLVDSYALACDERDGAAVAALFRPDGLVEIFSDVERPDVATIVRRGSAQIASGAPALARYLSTNHVVAQQSIVSWDTDAAEAVVYCTANHWYRRESGERANFVVHVRYLDKYQRSDGTWSIAIRRIYYDGIEHHLAVGPIL